MRSFSTTKLIALNILLIVFAMSPVLAHSACFMGSPPADSSANVDFHMVMADMSMADSQAPCHGQEINDNSRQGLDSENQCCTACSLLVIPPSTVKHIAEKQSQVIPGTLTLMVSRTTEIAFRPPINHLL